MAEQRAGILNNINTAKARLEAVNSKIAGRLSVLAKRWPRGSDQWLKNLNNASRSSLRNLRGLKMLISLPSARNYVK
jgi:hypothetical protein